MATARSIPTGYQREIERAQSQEHVLVFMTFDADTLATPIRVVNDPKDHTYGGETYTEFMFDIEILSDTDQPPRAQVSVQNVDRQIGEALRQTTDPIRCTITICPGSEFDVVVLGRYTSRFPGHVGIMIDDHRVLHTEQSCNACVVSFNNPSVRERILGFRRHVTRL